MDGRLSRRQFDPRALRATCTRTHLPRGTKSIITMSEQDQELAAFEAEMAKLAGEAPPTATAGQRGPKVISAAPCRPSAATEASALPSSVGPGGARLPVSQWPNPQQLKEQLERDYGHQIARAEQVAPARHEPESRPVQYNTHAEAAAAARASSSSSAYGKQPARPAAKSAAKGAASSSTTAAPLLGKRAAADPTERHCAGVSWVDKSLAEWPEDDFRIFVGDLGNETNDDVLAHAFAKYPSYQRARVVRNKNTQKSMGYGFVSFKVFAPTPLPPLAREAAHSRDAPDPAGVHPRSVPRTHGT